ncbi:MAG: hypothetical protein ACREGA_04695 [Candidatus Saccharimonadales bacterium]
MKLANRITTSIIAAVAVLALAAPVAKAQYSSPHYQTNQVFFGSGGSNSKSNNYQAKSAVGALGVGASSSANYKIQAGFNTTAKPFLAFEVFNGNQDLGVLSASSTAVATEQFSVRTYLASGYVVQTTAAPPSYSGYTINTLTTPTGSQTGQEQFGLNLVANNNCGGGLPPTGFGANPNQVPDNSFSFGQAGAGYATACQFQYHQNDIIAGSNRSSGETDYTASIIVNISQKTPAGRYQFNDVLVATSTY